jgi:hypothetical protein
MVEINLMGFYAIGSSLCVLSLNRINEREREREREREVY